MASFLRALCAAGIFLTLTTTVVLGQYEDPTTAASLSQPEVDRLRGEIAARLARLNIPTQTAETPSMRAGRARKAIEAGDFAGARQIIAAALADSKVETWRFYPFEPFIIDLPEVHSATFVKQLDDWVAHADGDPLPLLVRAQYYYNAAWARSGSYQASTTSSESADVFGDYMARALKDVDAATKLDRTNPYVLRFKIEILSSLDQPREMAAAFESGIAVQPNYYSLYSSMLNAIVPEWGDSMAPVMRFVDYYASKVSDSSPLKMMYLALYGDLLADAVNSCMGNARRDNDVLAPCVAIQMKKN